MFHDTPRLAGTIVAFLIGSAAVAEWLTSGAVWLGPVYLAAITIAAWALGSHVAVAIGVLVLSMRLVAGSAGLLPYQAGLSPTDFAIRALAVLVVIGIIGDARKACEREWGRARTDPLTGAMNRQAFFDIAKRNRNAPGWTALVYADLDGLKRLNDTEGHDRGDEGLRLFAEKVRKTIRKEDIFARLGGDEFAILMKVKNQEGGRAAAERLRRAINTGDPECSAHLRCSFGVLLLPDGVSSVDSELKAADDLMYRAKRDRLGLSMSLGLQSDDRVVALPLRSEPRSTARQSTIRERGIA